jgi:preprotein translocase subunit SecD
MERSWWWKAGLYGLVIACSVLYLVPTFVPAEKQPAFLAKLVHKKIQYGLDIQGGIHLEYEVDVDKAVAGKVDQLANLVEDALRAAHKDVAVTVTREGRDDIVFAFKTAADQAKLDGEVLRNFRTDLDEVERDKAGGKVRLKYDADQVAELQDISLRQALETLRNRVDKFGVSEPTIIKKATNIIVELPGLTQEHFERVKNVIGMTAQLQFKIVDDGSEYMKKVAASVPKDGPVTAEPDSWVEDKTGIRHEDMFLRAKKREDLEKFVAGLKGDLAIPADREIGFEEVAPRDATGDAPGEVFWRTQFLKKRVSVTGEYLSSADVSFDEMGRPEVAFTMNRQGAEHFGKLTGENVGRRMAIVLDEKITQAPTIQSQITDRGRITLGGFGDPVKVQQEAKDLVAVLRSGALPAPLKKTFETQVGPSTGQDSIDRAVTSMWIGAVAVVLFMLIYYRGAGLIANIAMVANMILMAAILAGFEAALTLPGLAGLVLTVGMAVDANIVIYERIREELRAGKSPRSAVDAGFDRAFWTVFDAHVTNFVAGVVLYSYGSGPIRGFAVTLLIGIITNLFTSVWFSRWMFDLVVGRRGHAPATLSI